MDLIKTGIGLTKTIKNVSRLKEILGVFYRNGFTDVLTKSNLIEKIPGFVIPETQDPTPEDILNSTWGKLIGYRLRKSFEELGPSFIKIGQLLSTREDIFPPEFVEEMKILQDQAKPIPFSEAKEILEKQWGKDLNKILKSLDENPIGMASIGVVYKGTLINGTEVVVKVRRPKIDRIVQQDFELVKWLVLQIEKVSEEIRYLGIGKVMEDFSKSLSYELDFRIEASNAERLKKVVAPLDKNNLFHIPKIYREYSTENILVMEMIKGVPFNKVESTDPRIGSIHESLLKAVDVFIHTILVDGFFHADLHGGNFFLLPEGRIGIIDFGLMGSLGKKSRENLIAILFSLTTHNYENLVYEFLDVAEYDKIPDIDSLIRDIKDSLTPYIGLSVQETNFSALLRALVTTLSKHQIYLPREWFIIFRALIALDGVGRSVNIDLNIYEIIEKDILKLIPKILSKEAAMEEAVWVGRDVLSSLRMLPRHFRWFLREFSKNNYALEIKLTGHERVLKHLTSSINFLGISIVSGFLVVSGSYLIDRKEKISMSSIPGITWIFWLIALILFFNSTRKIRKN